MTHSVVQRINELGPALAETADETEELGRLSDAAVKLVRDAGVMRMLQPKEHGGFEADPGDFAEAVMATASWCGSTGWVCGVGGVHPWEMALMDPTLQQQVWGEDQDTWIASPYAPGGFTVPTEGGYRLSGRWPFSSGTDHCQWVFLGTILGTDPKTPAQPIRGLHVVLPRSDYEILADSWQVMGLRGTGSKDVVVNDAFIPTYRTIGAETMVDGPTSRPEPLYRIPFYSIFPLGITASVVGMAEGLLRVHLEQARTRKTWSGAPSYVEDGTTTAPVAGAAAEIAASHALLVDNITRIFDKVAAGQEITVLDRAIARRNQISCAWRAARAANEIFARSGGNAIRTDNPLQRYFRDINAGLQHAIHAPGHSYASSVKAEAGLELTPTEMVLI